MVTEYKPKSEQGCRYSYDKLDNVVYLVSEEHVKNVYIDGGEAYISNLTEVPMRLEGFNISFTEESSLDERYKFNKQVNFSLHGHVPYTAFEGKYYVILKSKDGTKWMVNVDFPSKVTYTFNLDGSQYQTDFTFSSLSNFPTLRLATDIDEGVSPCKPLRTFGIDKLRMLEKDYCTLDTVNKTVYTYGKEFVDVEYLGQSCSLQESFDGDKVTTTIQFNIAFDAYKSSWHYNLLEFLENIYAAIITPKGSDNTFFCGFNFGLQPSFNVATSSLNGQSDIITVTLIEASSQGTTSAKDWDEDEDEDKRWVYVKKVGEILGYECVGGGIAKYILMQEVTKNGIPTGNYKALEGYESQFPTLNIVGTFSTVETFNNPDCITPTCEVSTNLPNTITYTTATCNTYTYSASCNWNVIGLADYMTLTPLNGAAGTQYTLTVCNRKTPTTNESSTFTVIAGDNIRIVNVNLTTDSGIINPTSVTINCLAQNVTFNFNSNCPIVVTSIDSRLSYNIANSQLVVNVPRNYSIESGITWTIGVKDCNNNTATATIIQDKTYERWVDTEGFICSGNTSYAKQQRYTGTTSTNINTPTSEYRTGAKIQDDDPRCGSSTQKWETSQYFICIDGDKWSFEEEYTRPQGGTWQKTGNTRLKEMVEASSSFCNQEVQYKWELTDRWQCYGGEIPTLPTGYTEVEYIENNSLAYIDTGFKPNQDTRILAEMQAVSSSSYNQHFGSGSWQRNNAIRLGYESGINGTLHVKYGTNNTWTVYSNITGDYNKHTYDWNKNELYRDNTLIGSVTYGNFQTTDNLGIFFSIEQGVSIDSSSALKGRVYSFKIYDDGTLVRDFIPAKRGSDNKYGLYDLITDTFYLSPNGNEFSGGSAIQ